MLFQKLKEGGHKPVFMLRHIVSCTRLNLKIVLSRQRDIKSPITVAQQKQLTKLGLPATSTANVLPKIKPASDTTSSPTKSTTLQAGQGRDGREARGLPELPSPGVKDDITKAQGTVMDADGKLTNVTYAVAIYPQVQRCLGYKARLTYQIYRRSPGRI